MERNIYKEVIVDSILNDIKKAQDNGILAGAIILTLSAIDAMAYLEMPMNQKEVHRKDFIYWVEKYMKTDPKQSYQYKGIDLYGARSGIVHRYGPTSRLSENGECNIFAYTNGSEHIYNPIKNKNLVIISVNRFINDFFLAVDRFLQEILKNDDLKIRVDSRITSLFRISKR